MDGDDDGNQTGQQRGWRPVPDPTLLTTEQLLREVAALRREIDLQLELRRGITDEKFITVDTQFELIERQRVEQKKDGKEALDAALAAAKEAVTKNEVATNEQLRQQAATFDAAFVAVRESLDDVKERVTKIESLTAGAGQRSSELRSSIGLYILLASVIVSVVVFISNVVTR